MKLETLAKYSFQKDLNFIKKLGVKIRNSLLGNEGNANFVAVFFKNQTVKPGQTIYRFKKEIIDKDFY